MSSARVLEGFSRPFLLAVAGRHALVPHNFWSEPLQVCGCISGIECEFLFTCFLVHSAQFRLTCKIESIQPLAFQLSILSPWDSNAVEILSSIPSCVQLNKF